MNISNATVTQPGCSYSVAGQRIKWKQKCLGNFPTWYFGKIISTHLVFWLVAYMLLYWPQTKSQITIISFKILSGIEYFEAERASPCPHGWEKSQSAPRVMIGEAVSWAEAGALTWEQKAYKEANTLTLARPASLGPGLCWDARLPLRAGSITLWSHLCPPARLEAWSIQSGSSRSVQIEEEDKRMIMGSMQKTQRQVGETPKTTTCTRSYDSISF